MEVEGAAVLGAGVGGGTVVTGARSSPSLGGRGRAGGRGKQHRAAMRGPPGEGDAGKPAVGGRHAGSERREGSMREPASAAWCLDRAMGSSRNRGREMGKRWWKGGDKVTLQVGSNQDACRSLDPGDGSSAIPRGNSSVFLIYNML